ncbi:hypothetical protein GGD56_006503 [Rhizobium mongolense]|nr:hypothetical protein [Rhizobium mongolense]
MNAYADEVCRGIGANGQDDLIALRDEGVAKIRVLLDRIRQRPGVGAQ